MKLDTARNVFIRDVLTPLMSRYPVGAANDFSLVPLHLFRHQFGSMSANSGEPRTSVHDAAGESCEMLSERTGFEPVEGCDPFTGLANRRFRPLSHLSKIV